MKKSALFPFLQKRKIPYAVLVNSCILTERSLDYTVIAPMSYLYLLESYGFVAQEQVAAKPPLRINETEFADPHRDYRVCYLELTKEQVKEYKKIAYLMRPVSQDEKNGRYVYSCPYADFKELYDRRERNKRTTKRVSVEFAHKKKMASFFISQLMLDVKIISHNITAEKDMIGKDADYIISLPYENQTAFMHLTGIELLECGIASKEKIARKAIKSIVQRQVKISSTVDELFKPENGQESLFS